MSEQQPAAMGEEMVPEEVAVDVVSASLVEAVKWRGLCERLAEALESVREIVPGNLALVDAALAAYRERKS